MWQCDSQNIGANKYTTFMRDQKVSLSKLAALHNFKVSSNINSVGQQFTVNFLDKDAQSARKSHIEWNDRDSKEERTLFKQITQNHIISHSAAIYSEKNKFTTHMPEQGPEPIIKPSRRKQIFETRKINKQCQKVEFPTFKDMSQQPIDKKNRLHNADFIEHDTTHFYSMAEHSPRSTGSSFKLEPSAQTWNSPFGVNAANNQSRESVQMRCRNSIGDTNHEHSIREISDYQIPKLEEKLEKQQSQLQEVVKYIQNSEELKQIQNSRIKIQNSREAEEKRVLIQQKKQQLSREIQSLREAEKLRSIEQSLKANQSLANLERQRLSRIRKIQTENERLYAYLKRSEQQSLQQSYSQGHCFQNDEFDLENHLNGQEKGGNVSNVSPIQDSMNYPDEDWSFRDNMPRSDGMGQHFRKDTRIEKIERECCTVGDSREISPVFKRQVNDISAISGLSDLNDPWHGSLSSENPNTFRQILSPLEVDHFGAH